VTAVLVPAASEAEWLEARRQGVTASEIAAILGLSPWESPFALYHRKTGTLGRPPDNPAMRLGRMLEGYVCDEFAMRYPEFRLRGDGRMLYRHPARPWQMATPDRIVVEPGGSSQEPLAVLEAKTSASYDGWGDDGGDVIPVYYRAQLLWQMDVLGVQTGFVAVLFLHSRALRVYEITLGAEAEKDLVLMQVEAELFLSRVADRDPPDVDWRPVTRAALKTLHPSVDDGTALIPRKLASRYRAACMAVKRAQQRKDLLENQVRDYLGDNRWAVTSDMARVARRDVYGLAAKTIERRASTVDKLVMIKPKETP
jgi:putative phage-type endonuclease